MTLAPRNLMELRLPRTLAIAMGLLFVAQSFKAQAEDSAAAEPAFRTRAGLIALYDFSEGDGQVVADRSGAVPAMDLRIGDADAVQRSAEGFAVLKGAVIRTEVPAARMAAMIRQTGEVSIEAWLEPATTNQTGPARIVTISRDTGERNITLGQDGDRFDVRLRTTQTSTNGTPSLATPAGSLSTALTHVVYTHDRRGRTRIYLNGQVAAEQVIAGGMENWSDGYHLAIANEQTGDRPWLGKLRRVAIFARELLPHEVQSHFRAGPGAEDGPADASANPSALLFETSIAPLLATHCLDCHDGSIAKGKLNLSDRAAAMAGGKHENVIVPGDAEKSLLWQRVRDDEMPEDRPALSARDKSLLKQWIDEGAAWSIARIDPTLVGGGTESTWARRLTVDEYIETVRSAVGVSIEEEARQWLPKDVRADGFSNTAYNLNVDLGHVEAYARLARRIVGKMDVPAFVRQFAAGDATNTESLRAMITGMGQWLLRGPLQEQEIIAYLDIATDVLATGGTREDAGRYLVQAMLQSPRFLYRVERQVGDGHAWPVEDFELASRLSYAIYGGPPDAQLFAAAEQGRLYDREAVREQIRRLLADPRAIVHSQRFIGEWLNLDRLEHLQPSEKKFGPWDPQLGKDMQAETLALFRHIAWDDPQPLSKLFNARLTFATGRLARHYGLEPAAEELSRYDLSSVPGRGGVLTHASVLTVGGDEASMVTRGLFVLSQVLRGRINDPPPCVDTTPVPPTPGQSAREISERRIADMRCGSCHGRFEPLAFGLERFDGLGRYMQSDEHGHALREDGEILFPGTAEPVGYTSTRQMMDLLADSPQVHMTITRKLVQWVIGRPLRWTDLPIIERIHEQGWRDGGTYQSLLTAILLSDLIQTTRTEPFHE